MAANGSIRLLEADPELGRFLSAEDRALAFTVKVPSIELTPGDIKIDNLLREAHCFAAVVTDGMLLQSVRLQEQAGLRLLGPGHLLSLAEAPPSMLILDGGVQATVPSRLALLGRDFLVATRRWPWLAAGLNARCAEQSEHLLTQLMICQLPRVDDRLLAMMWLLAETWGRVTASGTLLPLQLTHSALGGLVGARRPTVTLALRGLTEAGSVLRQADGWLLIKAPEEREAADEEGVGDLHPLPRSSPQWGSRRVEVSPDESRHAQDVASYAELRRTVTRLRAEHRVRTEQMRERLAEMMAARELVVSRRRHLTQTRTPPPRAPSS